MGGPEAGALRPGVVGPAEDQRLLRLNSVPPPVAHANA